MEGDEAEEGEPGKFPQGVIILSDHWCSEEVRGSGGVRREMGCKELESLNQLHTARDSAPPAKLPSFHCAVSSPTALKGCVSLF